MTMLSSWMALALAACAAQSSTPSPTIAGRYEITSSGSGCPSSPLDLELEVNGNLIAYGAMPEVLTAAGSGVYSASSCSAYECQSPPHAGVLIYSSSRVERTSSTTIHGMQAGLSLRGSCTEGVCPDGFGSNAPSCDFDATLAEPAPVITSVSPPATSSTSCSEPLTIKGGYFQTGAAVSYISVAPTCSTPQTLRDGTPTCSLVVDKVTATAITAHFVTCPAQDEAFMSKLTLMIANPSSGSDSVGNSLPGLQSETALQLDP
jgi:hypothetical protein